MFAGQLVLFERGPLEKMEEQRVREVQRINSQVVDFQPQGRGQKSPSFLGLSPK